MRERVKDFKDLEVWKKSHVLVLETYKVTRKFPNDEKFALVQQTRRASISVPANIAEGFRKRGKRDKKNFYNISQASLDELIYYLILSKDLGYIDKVDGLFEKAEEVAKMLSGLASSMEV